MVPWVGRLRDLSRDDPRTFAVRCAGVLAAVALLAFVWQGLTAVRALSEAEETVGSLADAVSSGNIERAKSELRKFDDATTRAHHRTDGPLWWLAARVPGLGDNFAAVSTIAEQTDAIADEALPGVVAVADQVRAETFRPKSGRVDLNAVATVRPVLASTDRVLTKADREVSEIRPEELIPPLQGPVGEFATRTHAAATAAAAAHEAARLLPTMLAGDGPTRRYLLMVMNNAEVRSIGGMPGSFAVLEARRGKIAMTEQASNTKIRRLVRLNVKPEVRAGFDRNVGYDLRDVAIIPDFPRVAALAARLAGAHWETDFDGVVAIDPVALGYVLGAVGQIDIGAGMSINQTNAAAILLNGIYLRYPRLPEDNEAQDDAFERSARRSFNALTGGRGDSVQALRALVRGVQENRILLWSAHRSEQARIKPIRISGSMTDERQGHRPQVGVYLTDTSQAKLDYYLHSETRVDARKCYAGDVQDVRVTTTLTSAVPQGSSLPPSVVGRGSRVPAGTIGLSVRIMAPPGGRIRAIEVDGRQAPVGGVLYRGRHLSQFPQVLGPGQTTVIVSEIRSGRSMPGDPLLKATPSAHPGDKNVVGPSACD